MKQLNGKMAIITGASEGLGRSLALAFAKEGAEAVSIVARNKERLEAVSHQINNLYPGTKVLAVVGDISLPEDVERIVATTLKAFGGRVDILLNNASTLGPTPMPYLLDYPLQDFHRVVNTNLIGPFLMIRNVLPSMIENGGSIINVTSDAGVVGYPGWGAYGISKFALEGMSETWAAELQDTNVRVNLVDPGDMNTSMHRAAEPGEDPGQWADPASVTEVFIYLASDKSRSITGQRFMAQEEWKESLKTIKNA
jgi:NAD(P)-dependent dehydrogenase (short-subunit alcohol dehydrogenase family)